MKKILLLLFAFSIQIIAAQEQDAVKAKRYFERTHYSEAIPLYEAIVTNNPSVDAIKNLADCYFYTNDLKSAQKYYSVLINKHAEDVNEDYFFRYAQTLKATDKYDEANAVLKEYYQKTANIQGLENFEKELKEIENIAAIGNRFEIKNLAINTENSEFGAVQNGENLVYAAVKRKPSLFDKVYKWTNETYLNLVTVPVLNSNTKESIVYFAKELNSGMHESNAVFTKDGKTMYFTRNNSKNGRKSKNKEKISTIQIFKSELVDGKWTNVKALPFNSEDYSVEHPALSPDEKTLYFASDMPGTLGSLDIFSVQINDGLFGTPINLGNKINTSKKEQFPFVAKDNKLYYSSNGLAGYGSLDVFVSELKNNEFSKPLNVGLPINSGLDDFCFIINSDNKQGYFSSNREGGQGSDDIYSLTEIKDLIIEDCKQFLAGTITDVDTKLPLENAIVVLQNADKEQIDTATTNRDGKFSFTVSCETAYTVLASKENYNSNSKSIKLGSIRNKTNDVSLALKSLESLKNEEEFAKTQQIEKEKADKEKEKAVAEAKKNEKIDNIIAHEKDVVKIKDKLVIKTDPIYFDYDLWYIRKDSKIILKRVIELMNKYPEMILEIGSHTDMRGNDKYNADLSKKRAESTKDFLVDLGISENRITAYGYGESQAVVNCKTEESCTEEQHELNRRSEFVIKGL